jgi:hypothetical protein
MVRGRWHVHREARWHVVGGRWEFPYLSPTTYQLLFVSQSDSTYHLSTDFGDNVLPKTFQLKRDR